MQIGQTDSESVEAVYKKLWIRGRQILSEKSLQNSSNFPFISKFEETQEAFKV